MKIVRYKLLLAVAIVVIAATIALRGYMQSNSVSPLPLLSKLQASPSPSPTPMPFRDLTVPYLRERSYASKLTTLEPAYERSDYKAYLTSYDSDGLKINGLLTEPSGTMPPGGWPAIIFIHGYIPPTIYETQGQAYSAYVDYLARNGFVVFKIDLRGHDKSEGEASGAYYSSDYSIDALNAYAALQKASFVNPKSIGIWGHSMAGNVTLRALVAKRDIPAAVIWAGAVYSYADQLEFGINDNSYRPPTSSTPRTQRRRFLFDTYGQFNADSPFWKQVAPTNYVSDIKTAIELHHAVDDTVVNIGYSRGLMKVLDSTTVPHQLYEYSSGGHNISGANFSTAMQRTSTFFKQHLTGEAK